MKLSAIVLTKNEQDNIERCLNSLDFCDEIVIVDDFSTDKTVQIAENHHAKVYKHHLENNFAAQRNFGMSKAKGDWCLFIDADEVVSDELMKEILVVVMSGKPDCKAYHTRRRDYFLGREMTMGEVEEVHSKGLVRLICKGSGRWQGEVHEKFVSGQSSGYLNNFIDHYPHPTIENFIRKINYYSSIRADELYRNGKRVNLAEIVFVPFLKFIYTYFFRFGFKDGAEGFIYSFFMAFHSFLVRVKLQLKWLTNGK